MRKIVTLKDSITQEDVYPITPGKLVLDKNGSNILGVLDSEIRNFSELTIRDEEILMEQSLNKISELSGLEITDENVKELAKLVVENEKTKQGIKSIKEKIEDIKDTLDKLGDICKSSEVINLSNIIKIGKPNEIPIDKELRLDEDGNFYIGIDGEWFIISEKEKLNYFSIISLKDNSTISLPTNTSPNLMYKLNSNDWTQWDYNTVTINKDDILYLKGDNSNEFSTSGSAYNNFSITGKVELGGNIMSLLYGDDFENNNTLPGTWIFYKLFYNCTGIISAKNLILPATTLANYCYNSMFENCTSLTEAPQLPATTLKNYCYYNMFYNCRKLNHITMLATDISAYNCLSSWVYGVASSGTFIKNSAATWDITGVSGIPSGWTVEEIDVPSTYTIDSTEEEDINNPSELDYFTLDIDSVWIDSIEVWYKSLQLNIYPGSIEISNLVDQIKSEYPEDNEDSWRDIYFKITPFIPGDVILIYQNGVQVDYTVNDSGDYILPELNINDYIEIKTIQS